MDGITRRESGASEVIGAVLLVALVVVGGAVVASMVFGQPTPKAVPHVMFGVAKESPTTLMLHHTGGDTLSWGDYNVYIYNQSGSFLMTDYVLDKVNPWSSDGDMLIGGVKQDEEGTVVLAYRDGAGGETVLRRVAFADYRSMTVVPTPADWTISGFKLNASGGAYTGPNVTITLYRKMPGNDKWQPFSDPISTNGSYIFHVLEQTETYQIRETVPDLWRAVSPASGIIDSVKLNPGHIRAENQNFTNELIPPTPTPTPTATPTPTPTPTPSFISGHKYRVDANGNSMTSSPFMAGITIILERKDGNKWAEVARTTTDANGYYSFPAPTDGGTYQLRELFNALRYTPYNQTNGIISGVVPGSTNNNFYNKPIIGDGIVMYLNKTVEDDGDLNDDDGGYVVNGTYLQGDARHGNWVTINGYTYTFDNNEQFRFTIIGDQYSGELLGNENLDLTSLTFNVLFQVNRNGQWVTPANMGFDPVIGRPSEVHVEQINKNKINELSTLTYRYPQYTPTDTLLRLNGEIVIDERDPPGDNQYLEFTTLHIVHDNRYHEGNNVMWISLLPGYDQVLVQGTCLSP